MQGPSSSAESKLTGPATSVPGRYKCAYCSRVFDTTRARGGHQIVHRKAREMRNKPYGPVLAAVLIHHFPSDDEEEEEKTDAETAGNQEGTRSSQNSPTEVIQTESKAKENNESVTNKQKNKAVEFANPKEAKAGSSQRRPNRKAVRDKSDQQQPPPQKKPQPRSQPQKQPLPQPQPQPQKC